MQRLQGWRGRAHACICSAACLHCVRPQVEDAEVLELLATPISSKSAKKKKNKKADAPAA